MHQLSTRQFALPRRRLENSSAAPAAFTQEFALAGVAETSEGMAKALEASGDYRILRRLVPRPPEPRSADTRIGLIIDLETTSLDTSRNEVLEIAAVKFAYSEDPLGYRFRGESSGERDRQRRPSPAITVVRQTDRPPSIIIDISMSVVGITSRQRSTGDAASIPTAGAAHAANRHRAQGGNPGCSAASRSSSRPPVHRE